MLTLFDIELSQEMQVSYSQLSISLFSCIHNWLQSIYEKVGMTWKQKMIINS